MYTSEYSSLASAQDYAASVAQHMRPHPHRSWEESGDSGSPGMEYARLLGFTLKSGMGCVKWYCWRRKGTCFERR